MANNGASYTEIGEAFGAPASAIRNALTRRGKYVTRKDVAKVNRQPEKTLRDEFAMAALPALIGLHRADLRWQDVAPQAYALADKMMKERME